MIDTHAHIYASAFLDDREQMIARAREVGVEKILMPNIDVASIPEMLAVGQAFPQMCHPMLGIHPCYVDQDIDRVLAEIEPLFAQHSFIAVGEIGLDFYHDRQYVAEQKKAFRHQLNWAKERDLPVVIHTRDSMDDTLAILREAQDGSLRGVFHCFVTSLQDVQAITDLGFHLGIGGVATFKNSDLKFVLPEVDIKHLILETDSPYLTPHPHRGKRNEPYYLPVIAEKLAELHGVAVEQIIASTTENARQLFKL